MNEIDRIKQSIIDAATMLRDGGYLTTSLHGNISARIPGTDDIILTSRSYLHECLDFSGLTVVSLKDGTALDKLHPSSAEIVDMHRIAYDIDDSISAVIHTHSPHATAFAVASREIPVAYEAMVRYGIHQPVPVAAYGPRGSQQSIDNILERVSGNRAILLENHGLLAFGSDAMNAARIVAVIEEACMIYTRASMIGDIRSIPLEMIEETERRRSAFAG